MNSDGKDMSWEEVARTTEKVGVNGDERQAPMIVTRDVCQ